MSKELFKTNESLEMYIETIYRLSLNDPKVKMSDVAASLGVTKPSCHKAMTQLKEKGYILQERYGGIQITDAGKELGNAIFLRHQLITYYLKHSLSLSDELAENDACRLEHVLSEETMNAIATWVNTHKLQKKA